jgi:hypothetical protein
MSIVGIALRGFGRALGKTVKNTVKKKLDAKRKVFGGAAKSNELTQVSKKLKKTADEVKKSMARATTNSKLLTGKIGLKKD